MTSQLAPSPAPTTTSLLSADAVEALLVQHGYRLTLPRAAVVNAVLRHTRPGRYIYAVGGNEAQFINHSCEPNCAAVTDKKRIFIEALRDIEPGEELLYDYNLTRESDDEAALEQRYACHCGAPTCRGTMLIPKNKQKKHRARA